MSKKALTLSIVIPVYNEERYIGACLDAISRQSKKPLEVIVVDNNSTDKTLEIAKKYKFVKILYEKRQHQAFAQKTGFDKARGDILGRIDADTRLPKNWVHNVVSAFESDPSLAGVTGSGIPYDMQIKKPAKVVFEAYFRLASMWAKQRLMWGANCAFTKPVWQKISGEVLLRNDIWEDFDLSFCIGKYGRIKFLKNIDIETSFRAVHESTLHHIKYQFRAVRTFSIRTNKIRAFFFMLTWYTTLLLYLPVRFDQWVIQPLKNHSKH